MSKKIWRAIAILAVVLVLSLAVSCGGRTEYVFKGVIGEEKVEFLIQDRIVAFDATNVLKVEKSDQSKIEYIDSYREDLKIESVIIITPDGMRTRYRARSSNPAVIEVVAQAQKQLDQYLKKIWEIKTAPLLRE